MQEVDGNPTHALRWKRPVRRPIGVVEQVRSERLENERLPGLVLMRESEAALESARAKLSRVLSLRLSNFQSRHRLGFPLECIDRADLEDFVRTAAVVSV